MSRYINVHGLKPEEVPYGFAFDRLPEFKRQALHENRTDVRVRARTLRAFKARKAELDAIELGDF